MATAPTKKKRVRKAKVAKKTAATPDPGPPRFFVHSLRPAWGRAVLEEGLDDRIRYAFEDGRKRTFLLDNDAMVEVEVPADEADTLARRLLGGRIKKTTVAPPPPPAPVAAEPAEDEPDEDEDEADEPEDDD